MAKQQAFVTLKDHKDNFTNKPSCRLINPAKSNLGRVSKQIIEKINNKVRLCTKANQWKNTDSVIKWFNELEDKQSLTFLSFDIVEYYPSISEILLTKSLDFASQYVEISDQDRNIIMHARKSLLFDDGNAWCKRNNSTTFDVTMGSFDGAEICELVGLFILHHLTSKLNNKNIGLYRDDGLAVFRNMGPRTADIIRTRFSELFREFDLKITSHANLKIVNFLDVTFNLSDGKFQPYRKPDNPPMFINTMSNHPPSIIRQIPRAIGHRISNLSCDHDEFVKAAPMYNEALEASGFTSPIEYNDADRSNAPQNNEKKKRTRKVIWFNPPFSRNVKCNVGGCFLRLIDKHFPSAHKLSKIFNRINTKVSYCCMDNMTKIIRRHNNKILRPAEPTPSEKKCNCRRKPECPLSGACLTKSIVYKAEISATGQETKHYIGMTEHEFKTRFNTHKLSFNHEKHANSTALSKHVWKLKKLNADYSIKWSILKRAMAYTAGAKQCGLCLAEKLCIINANKDNLLNKRSELISKCRHENKFYACNYKPA